MTEQTVRHVERNANFVRVTECVSSLVESLENFNEALQAGEQLTNTVAPTPTPSVAPMIGRLSGIVTFTGDRDFVNDEERGNPRWVCMVIDAIKRQHS
jgi:hypothetical protein